MMSLLLHINLNYCCYLFNHACLRSSQVIAAIIRDANQLCQPPFHLLFIKLRLEFLDVGQYSSRATTTTKQYQLASPLSL